MYLNSAHFLNCKCSLYHFYLCSTPFSFTLSHPFVNLKLLTSTAKRDKTERPWFLILVWHLLVFWSAPGNINSSLDKFKIKYCYFYSTLWSFTFFLCLIILRFHNETQHFLVILKKAKSICRKKHSVVEKTYVTCF